MCFDNKTKNNTEVCNSSSAKNTTLTYDIWETTVCDIQRDNDKLINYARILSNETVDL
jgi:hypothetical protein